MLKFMNDTKGYYQIVDETPKGGWLLMTNTSGCNSISEIRNSIKSIDYCFVVGIIVHPSFN